MLTMRKRILPLCLLVALLAIGGLLIVSHSQTEPIQAAGYPLEPFQDLSYVPQGAVLGIQGSYQTEDPSNQGYALWKYRSDMETSANYYRQNQCDRQDDDDEVFNGHDLTWQIVNYDTNTNPPTAIYGHASNCVPRDAPNKGDNLTHNWNTYTGIYKNALELEKMEPFLVIGTTPVGEGGIQSPELEMNVWLPNPNERNSEELIIKADDFCNLGSHWDMNSNLGQDTLSIKLEGLRENLAKVYKCPSTYPATLDFKVNDIVSDLGEPRERQSFTRLKLGTPEIISYELYKLTVSTDKDRAGLSYTNQFQLKITSPNSSYFGIIETDIKDEDEPENALGLGMRLPGDHFSKKNTYIPGTPLAFRRLQILWEVNLYGADDSSKSCSEGGITGKFGLYDHDYPTASWLDSDYPPSLQIFHTDRDDFLKGGKANWEKDLNGNGSIDPNEGFFKFNDQNKRQNKWDTAEYDDFKADKIYRFRFFNLDQRSWMQIGIPFSQSAALQPCAKNPLVKVYHGDVSAGGWFVKGETSKACREEDADNLLNADEGRIYAHASLVGEGDEGSSAEYAVYARKAINTFYSGYKRPSLPPVETDPPDSPSRLTFANSDTPWGGNYSDTLRCIPNWWRRTKALEDKKDSTITQLYLNQSNGNPLGQDLEEFYSPPQSADHTLTISVYQTLTDLDLKAAIYIDGDLLIENNIINNNDGREKLNQIKSIYFIVRGDILIEPDVTQIDAVLIAIPTDDNQTKNGRIFTCYIAGLTDDDSYKYLHYDPVTEEEIFSGVFDITKHKEHDQKCRERLKINGALIARQIRLGRVTDPNASPGYYNLNEGPVTEEINFLPEYYIGTPLLPAHTDWYYTSDSVTILPVNF